jgi:hypothetical protein
MHLVRGMTSLNTKKRKTRNKSKSLAKARLEHEQFLKSVGYKGNGKAHRSNIPDYKVDNNLPPTSDVICSNGTAKDRKIYTGNEIAGIVTTHKSNLMPVRKDNKQAAIDAANMRR